MKHIVLGTAGHIDHGKTLLTKALTGVDCDRLAEEKARGITIELGFAKLNLGGDRHVSIVDVPGHEKFVKTMMAGASGIDGAMLVVAADDGVMPQTREHLDILQLLRVQAGIVVITKCDLADDARLAQVRAQIAQLTRRTFLENAPVLAVSAATGQGIEELKDALRILVDALQQRSGERPFRLPVDRVFPVKGFGNVITGTQTDGTIRLEDTVMLYPAGIRGTVRSLQNHNKAANEAPAGSRTAMSLRLEGREEPSRGCTVAYPGSMQVTNTLTVYLTVTPDCPYRIRNSSQLHFFHETREVVCRLRLLDADVLTAGKSGYAQLQLAEPVAVRYGDRFILRFFSPVLTVCGGTVLDGREQRLRRKNAVVLERLQHLNSERGSERLLQRITDCGLLTADDTELRLLAGETMEEHEAYLNPLMENGSVLRLGDRALLASSVLEQLKTNAVRQLSAFHQEYPLQPGMRVSVLCRQLFPEEAPSAILLERLKEDGVLKEEGGFLSLRDFVPVFTQQHKIMQRKLQHFYREAWFQAPDRKIVDEKFAPRGEIYPQVLANMRLTGQLITLTPRYMVHPEAYAQALSIFEGLFDDRQQVTLAEFRTAAGISRKYAQLFLEYWDRQGICRRVGDARILLKRSTKESN